MYMRTTHVVAESTCFMHKITLHSTTSTAMSYGSSLVSIRRAIPTGRVTTSELYVASG
ncbi:hypothetical protein PISMIDRAFT_685410 [Pisolithus microcarpus 441]|uniref:Uncharacterized protein n=1 Tax=Pisolithus microcarpus 441 TaxID=765257 RepID=A0A0C9Z4A6_9AGAM|nr:hypothetical protein BKA83DRAFT_685410 [Pisolithus microcarpus]KIK17292.1 hypothetical protein PISMIDRAFT_685410 [Pisolithus microcarpus 441]